MKPIIVHSMGRCGSRTIYNTLRHNGIQARHCHYLTQLKRAGDVAADNIIKALGMDVFVIVPIREPLSRNLSAYYHNYRDYNVNEFVKELPPSIYQDWFDAEIYGYWGVDVYRQELVNGWNIYGNMLVIRSENFSQFGEAFKALTGQDAPQLVSDGVTGGQAYQRIKEMQIPQAYVDALKDTQYYKHFYMRQT